MSKSPFHALFENSTAQFASPRHWMVSPTLGHLAEALVGKEAGILVADLSRWSKLEIYTQDSHSVVNTSSSVWRLAPNKYLSVLAPDDILTTHQQMLGRFFAHLSTIETDVTSIYTHLFILGKAAGHLLAKLSSLSLAEDPLPDGSCSQGSVARIRCIVRGEHQYPVPAFHLLCARDLGVSLCAALLRAGREFSITLIDEAALDSIRVSQQYLRVRS